jgi:hypothetical protein
MEIRITANLTTKEKETLQKVGDTLEGVANVVVKALQVAEKPIRLWSKFW